MSYKILVATILFIGFSVVTQAQIVISSGDELIKEFEKKAERQRAAEIADPTLSKNRPGRIATKEEKKAMQKKRLEKQQQLGKALATEKNKGKIKMTTSKDRKKQPSKGRTKQPNPTKGTVKELKN